MKKSHFLLEFLKHPRQVGTPTRSSLFLVRGIVREIAGDRIVELGPGDGPVTKGILKVLPEYGRLVSIENNRRLYEQLRQIIDPRFTAVYDTAENLEKRLEELEMNEVDCIVSGLPLTSLDGRVKKKVLEACKRHSLFIQYKYWGSKGLLEKYFSRIRTKLVLRNAPPAVIYVCRNANNFSSYPF